MTWLFEFWRSSIGGKVTMAATGVVLFGFVLAHLLGNLQLLAGAQAINDYALFLSSRPLLLWLARTALLLVFVLHVVTGIRLARANRQARPVRYHQRDTVVATFASRSMVWSGLSLLVFVVWHLLHFTFGVTNPEHYARKGLNAQGHDVHAMVTASFAVPGIAIAYAAFQIVLFFHLSHGFQSFAQSVGFRHGRYVGTVRRLSFVLAALIAGGNMLLSLSVLTGIVAVAP
jgi:succinate dehydrogenase / fumarate reductase cytochrome b subunit